MLAKFLKPAMALRPILLCANTVKSPNVLVQRSSGHFIPPDQYSTPIPKRLHLVHVLTVYWETIPLFITTITSLTLCLLSCVWAIYNKVDVVYTTHNRETISRTMNLRVPSTHKIIMISDPWPPWPEMQNVLDKMYAAEKRARARAQSCAHP
ncbi:unnamed protein product [Leptidea sinapis]|uniref:Uncharacterized protein n=1 Tax=Leptidea sinapis TaxID=189913 RepID=A0A5E4Q956_9NEOP|nr:unnamed protein product [Leptidea sinapis]